MTFRFGILVLAALFLGSCIVSVLLPIEACCSTPHRGDADGCQSALDGCRCCLDRAPVVAVALSAPHANAIDRMESPGESMRVSSAEPSEIFHVPKSSAA